MQYFIGDSVDQRNDNTRPNKLITKQQTANFFYLTSPYTNTHMKPFSILKRVHESVIANEVMEKIVGIL